MSKIWGKKMKCLKCGFDNLMKSKFCIKCGNKMNLNENLICPNCKSQINGEYNFCPNCGSNFEESESNKINKNYQESLNFKEYSKIVAEGMGVLSKHIGIISSLTQSHREVDIVLEELKQEETVIMKVISKLNSIKPPSKFSHYHNEIISASEMTLNMVVELYKALKSRDKTHMNRAVSLALTIAPTVKKLRDEFNQLKKSNS